MTKKGIVEVLLAKNIQLSPIIWMILCVFLSTILGKDILYVSHDGLRSGFCPETKPCNLLYALNLTNVIESSDIEFVLSPGQYFFVFEEKQVQISHDNINIVIRSSGTTSNTNITAMSNFLYYNLFWVLGDDFNITMEGFTFLMWGSPDVKWGIVGSECVSSMCTREYTLKNMLFIAGDYSFEHRVYATTETSITIENSIFLMNSRLFMFGMNAVYEKSKMILGVKNSVFIGLSNPFELSIDTTSGGVFEYRFENTKFSGGEVFFAQIGAKSLNKLEEKKKPKTQYYHLPNANAVEISISNCDFGFDISHVLINLDIPLIQTLSTSIPTKNREYFNGMLFQFIDYNVPVNIRVDNLKCNVHHRAEYGSCIIVYKTEEGNGFVDLQITNSQFNTYDDDKSGSLYIEYGNGNGNMSVLLDNVNFTSKSSIVDQQNFIDCKILVGDQSKIRLENNVFVMIRKTRFVGEGNAPLLLFRTETFAFDSFVRFEQCYFENTFLNIDISDSLSTNNLDNVLDDDLLTNYRCEIVDSIFLLKNGFVNFCVDKIFYFDTHINLLLRNNTFQGVNAAFLSWIKKVRSLKDIKINTLIDSNSFSGFLGACIFRVIGDSNDYTSLRNVITNSKYFNNTASITLFVTISTCQSTPYYLIEKSSFLSNNMTIAMDVKNSMGIEVYISDSKFKSNYAGMALKSGFLLNTVYLTITKCEFIDNESFDGGGALILHSDLSQFSTFDWIIFFQNCMFRNNGGKGGGVIKMNDLDNLNSFSYLQINDCKFYNNFATKDQNGGAIYLKNSKMIITSSEFIGNYAENGGAIFVEGKSSISIDNTTEFTKNNAKGYGGAVLGNYKELTARDRITASIYENSAGFSGGGVYFQEFPHNIEFLNESVINNKADHEGDNILTSPYSYSIIPNEIGVCSFKGRSCTCTLYQIRFYDFFGILLKDDSFKPFPFKISIDVYSVESSGTTVHVKDISFVFSLNSTHKLERNFDGEFVFNEVKTTVSFIIPKTGLDPTTVTIIIISVVSFCCILIIVVSLVLSVSYYLYHFLETKKLKEKMRGPLEREIVAKYQTGAFVVKLERLKNEEYQLTTKTSLLTQFDLSNFKTKVLDNPKERMKYRIGSGTYSDVYHLENMDGNEYAFKHFKLEENEELKQSIIRDIQILATLNHSQVIRIFGISSNPFGYVTEFCKVSVFSLLVEGGISDLKMKTEIFLKTCYGLRYLHKWNVLHLDLKWDQILIDFNNQVKLIDFGLSVKTSEKLRGVRGNAFHCAPETTNGQPYTKAADIFALGIMLYELMYENLNPFNLDVNKQGKFNSGDLILVQKNISIGTRPRIPENELNKWYCRLMMDCWDQYSESRPKIGTIVKQVENVYKEISKKSGKRTKKRKLIIDEKKIPLMNEHVVDSSESINK